MIDVLKQQLHKGMAVDEKLNITREYLQILCLKIMYDKGFLSHLAFVGGTALRIIFDLRRFSEDLDFSLVNKKEYDFSAINAELIRGFGLYGLKADSKPKKEGSNVNGTFLKFTGLLKEVGLSPMASQTLSIKVEVDSRPPEGGTVVSTYVNKVYPITITHYDLPSMFATKLHACFYRKYLKGRDFYDFIWYLGKKVTPNIALLNNAITQTQGTDPGINKGTLKGFLLENIRKVDLAQARRDVERFLEDKSELRLFDVKAIEQTIEHVYSD